MIHDPFGDNGLKVAESREVVELMNNPPIGDGIGVVVVGPMDRANNASADILLKSIEEFDSDVVRPVLWAHDEMGTLGTIRSRCLRQWCPGVVEYDIELVEDMRSLVNSSLSGDTVAVVEKLKEKDPRTALEAAAVVLAQRGIDDTTKELWAQVRKVLRYRNPTFTETLSAFL
jgi:hypothetical protein